MPCFKPLQGYYSKYLNVHGNRNVVFNIIDSNGESVVLPCGKCVGCRLEYSRQWAIRCMHEADLYKDTTGNCFVTLTYNDEFLPAYGSLHYPDLTRFMKRLRKRFGSGIRFYACGEYGSLNHRPHFHILLFNFTFNFDELLSNRSGIPLYRSNDLDLLWSCPNTGKSFGFASVGTVTFESAAYVARYMMKKVKGEDVNSRYWTRMDEETGEVFKLAPEQARMSLRPGIAKEWFDRYYSDVYVDDSCVVNGRRVKPPRYYDRLLKDIRPEVFDNIRESRQFTASHFYEDNSPQRLRSKESCCISRLKHLTREL